MEMRYLSARVGQALLVLWASFTVSFVLLQLLPGDAIAIKFQNPELGLNAQQIAQMRTAYGADAPLWRQYLESLGGALRGDFGYSLQAGVPVSALLAASLPATLRLAALGFTLALVIALALAALSTLSAGRPLRRFFAALPSLFVAVPTFWLGITLIQLFSFQLRLIPVINPGFWEGLILPVVTLAVPVSAPLAQLMIRNIDVVLHQPFVTVARAKGASHRGVLWRHVARNALLPVLTVAGLLLGELIAGALVTETVFGLNGLGQLTRDAVNNQDLAVLQAIVLVAAFGFVLINLLVDLLYPLFDPRLSLSRRTT
ncbi:ABC transporter permease [Cronobacter dublinensis]|mgnify:FL=1|uniref:ABC transporter permease n=1 Tax=Cronobacter dublinensis TaxID=413497 RepID=UPI00039C0F7C|nr:ABC transporter permease [Cronobacter dublinensis]EGT4357532.1 ABC transporter permease [Cronobacter dublinensis]EKF2279050.1 ABC transporter permease [Cronobacter dublinensis]EKF2293141.1 ABC transporter permease [Cronobacter dublinensis]EKF2294716.1 ABC transporter permease [Cronobacter dublinensis]EKF2296951.1 ABC transporter permease [Cronobacter dublinensis]